MEYNTASTAAEADGRTIVEQVTTPWNKLPCCGISYHVAKQVTMPWNKLWHARESVTTSRNYIVSQKNCAKLFLSELRQISTDSDNFWQKDGKEAEIMRGALIFHLN